MRFLKLLPILLTLTSLCACQHIPRETIIRNRANDYLRTSLIAPLKVPPGLSHPDQAEVYPLPKVLPVGNIEKVSVQPPGFGTL